MSRRTASERGGGFTLIELLVTVSIIGLLVGILAPSLQGARSQARTALCGTRIRAICHGMSFYAEEFDDCVVGSPVTSGSYFFFERRSQSDETVTGWCTQPWDWAGPAARMLDIPLLQKNVKDLFNAQRANKHFLCPANRFTAPAWRRSRIDAGPGPMVSYNTPETFLFASWETGLRFGRPIPHREEGRGMTTMPLGWAERLPSYYLPRSKYIGNPSEKVFIADGSRYSITTLRSDYDLSRYAHHGGAYSDTGPYIDLTKGWNRWGAFDDNPLPGTVDPRVFAYRHGYRKHFGPLGAYKLQVGFFDGHTEVMTDSTSANPHLWLPRHATVDLGAVHVYPDVKERFGTGRITIR